MYYLKKGGRGEFAQPEYRSFSSKIKLAVKKIKNKLLK